MHANTVISSFGRRPCTYSGFACPPDKVLRTRTPNLLLAADLPQPRQRGCPPGGLVWAGGPPLTRAPPRPRARAPQPAPPAAPSTFSAASTGPFAWACPRRRAQSGGSRSRIPLKIVCLRRTTSLLFLRSSAMRPSVSAAVMPSGSYMAGDGIATARPPQGVRSCVLTRPATHLLALGCTQPDRRTSSEKSTAVPATR